MLELLNCGIWRWTGCRVSETTRVTSFPFLIPPGTQQTAKNRSKVSFRGEIWKHDLSSDNHKTKSSVTLFPHSRIEYIRNTKYTEVSLNLLILNTGHKK
jgi:hypothetical protein